MTQFVTRAREVVLTRNYLERTCEVCGGYISARITARAPEPSSFVGASERCAGCLAEANPGWSFETTTEGAIHAGARHASDPEPGRG